VRHASRGLYTSSNDSFSPVGLRGSSLSACFRPLAAFHGVWGRLAIPRAVRDSVTGWRSRQWQPEVTWLAAVRGGVSWHGWELRCGTTSEDGLGDMAATGV
jgi:hypothetical protein